MLLFIFILEETNFIPLYDIYNNGYHIGGDLNVTFDRYFVYEGNNLKSNSYLTTSKIGEKLKYENRMHMSDITMRIGTVVSLFYHLRQCFPKVHIFSITIVDSKKSLL